MQGEKIAFAPSALAVDSETGVLDITVPLPEDGNTNFKLTCRLVGQLNTHELAEYLKKKAQMSPNCLTCIVALNGESSMRVDRPILTRYQSCSATSPRPCTSPRTPPFTPRPLLTLRRCSSPALVSGVNFADLAE
jgi:hypothetical protein